MIIFHFHTMNDGLMDINRQCCCSLLFTVCLNGGQQDKRRTLSFNQFSVLQFFFLSFKVMPAPQTPLCPGWLTRVLMDYRELHRSIKQFLLTERGVTVWNKSIECWHISFWVGVSKCFLKPPTNDSSSLLFLESFHPEPLSSCWEQIAVTVVRGVNFS